MARGVFITVEGGEGSGKSSLIKTLSEWLYTPGLTVTREPGGTAVGELIRDIFLHCGTIGEVTEILLVLAARVEHVSTVVEPALKRGAVVLCDRYIDSTMAYQAFGRGGDVEKIWELATTIVPLLPDLTLYLDVSPNDGFQRIHSRQKRDRLECEASTFHERVREGFLLMAKRCPARIVVVDASKKAEEVAAEAKHIISERFPCICTNRVV